MANTGENGKGGAHAAFRRRFRAFLDRVWRNWLIIAYALLPLGLWAIAVWLNPFDIPHSTSRASAVIVGNVEAAFTDMRDQRRPVVLLIDEKSVADSGSGPWPLPTRAIQKLLTDVAAYEPAAVFLDIVLPAPRAAPSEPIGRGRKAAQAVGFDYREPRALRTLNRRLLGLPAAPDAAEGRGRKVAEKRCREPDSPWLFLGAANHRFSPRLADAIKMQMPAGSTPRALLSPAFLWKQQEPSGSGAHRTWMASPAVLEWRRADFAYPLTIDLGRDATGKPILAPSPAVLLAYAYCQTNWPRTACRNPRVQGTDATAPETAPDNRMDAPAICRSAITDISAPISRKWPDMRPRWDISRPEGWRRLRLDCADTPNTEALGWAGRLIIALRHYLSWMNVPGSDLIQGPRSYCPPHSTVFVDFGAIVAPNMMDFLKRRIEDNVVLIGTDLALSADRGETPVHRGLPGVYRHAIAYDNLLKWGADYPRAGRRGLVVEGLLTLLLGALAALHFQFLFALQRAGPTAGGHTIGWRDRNRLNLNVAAHFNILFFESILALLAAAILLDMPLHDTVLLFLFAAIVFPLSIVHTLLIVFVAPLSPLWRVVRARDRRTAAGALAIGGIVLGTPILASHFIRLETTFACYAILLSGYLLIVAGGLVASLVRSLAVLKWTFDCVARGDKNLSITKIHIDLCRMPVKIEKFWSVQRFLHPTNRTPESSDRSGGEDENAGPGSAEAPCKVRQQPARERGGGREAGPRSE